MYINLPVLDLNSSIAFYTHLGFVQNLQFTDQKASAMNWDQHLTVMLLTYDFYRTFLPSGTKIADSQTTNQVLHTLQFEHKEAVDAFFAKAMDAGGSQTIDMYDHGFMYGRDFADPDGHIWEAFWMDPSYIAQP
jgi:predicted lactoylglutathione lyase